MLGLNNVDKPVFTRQSLKDVGTCKGGTSGALHSGTCRQVWDSDLKSGCLCLFLCYIFTFFFFAILLHWSISIHIFSANISLLTPWYIYKLIKQKYPEEKEKVILQSLGFCICTQTCMSVRPTEKLCGVLKFTFNFGGTIWAVWTSLCTQSTAKQLLTQNHCFITIRLE